MPNCLGGMGFRMKSYRRQIYLVGLFLAVLAGVFTAEIAVADPMTGGNVPYEDCAPPCATSYFVPPPRCPWYFQADAVGLRRDPYGNTPFATLKPQFFDVALSTAELDRQFKGGTKFLFGHTLGDTPYSVEGSYFWIDTWNSSAVLRNTDVNALGTDGNLFSPFSNFAHPAPLLGFDYNSLVTIQNTSQLQNGEVNVKYLLPMQYNGFRASLLTGVRYVSVQEHFFYHSESAEPAGGSTINITTRTTNDLIGPQIGGFFEFYSLPHSWITFEVKGAICGNTSLQATSLSRTLSDGSPVTSYGSDAHTVATAFVGDLELMFNWQITPHCIARMGYQAMWVDGLALATENFGPASGILQIGTATINTGGETVYHGPHLGVEITW
jgi:hypothetical protein